MATFKLTKVIDPHDHMPSKVMDAFFKVCEEAQRDNNSYMKWMVGEHACSGDTPNYNLVELWLRDNFELYEQVIILYWL